MVEMEEGKENSTEDVNIEKVNNISLVKKSQEKN